LQTIQRTSKIKKKKQQLIIDCQRKWKALETSDLKKRERRRIIGETFNITDTTVKKYLKMGEDEIKSLDKQKNYKKRKTVMDDYMNIIYKMLRDGINPTIIYAYVKEKGYQGSETSLVNYIELFSKNNFNKSINIYWDINEEVYPEDIIIIKRYEVLKFILTKNPKTIKNEAIEQHINMIKEKYRIVNEIETIFTSFYKIIMGDDEDKLNDFLETYQDSKISSFCNGIKKDIVPVKNSISFTESSGFVEGNNNKFKLIKRIVYGRSKLVNLSKKCFLAFSIKRPSFNLLDLIP